ncbi:hypothetical protein ABH892_002613 [Paenibacillus sp. RC254]|uniref:hypothetical protein n=1 Tax=unclassified Paenibacillus TaxID=185978 RepID=UPI0024BA5038|nr:hypothetical protein [Paenibacillus sp. RC334]
MFFSAGLDSINLSIAFPLQEVLYTLEAEEHLLKIFVHLLGVRPYIIGSVRIDYDHNVSYSERGEIMFPIYPVNEANVAPHRGRLVCAVLHDGTRHVGILSGCGKGKLMLNGYPSSFSNSLYAGNYNNKGKQEAKKISSKKKKRNSKNKANSSAKISSLIKPTREPLSPSPPYDTGGYGNGGPGYGGGYGGYGYGAGLALDLALIAFLFLLI